MSILEYITWLSSFPEKAWFIIESQQNVQFIYFLLFFMLWMMTYLTFKIARSHKKVQHFNENYYLMEFLINFPIALGVIGTLYAISQQIALSNTETSLLQVMSSNFNQAIVTTIIGGFSYGYCFILQGLLARYINLVD